ncbi:TPA: protoporphyrinogen oxidase [Listeria monocytogenes]|uniref:protoporphyrinogen oxidase n=1 Tax=Listeria monocytogenes TaxID=1639 RepID=UPI00074D60A0|nr:protoporphyrinogen oxidase [Listeria monocytogenes]EDE2198894.1 protoporphyrinogen oxidase [Listeria monocytogenes]EEO7553427.1 protoporphyrinogen oxidase [Listeria monocytogenes]EEO9089163.1 protoporphyrinogen oxidase [Listeria monocytogenes]OER14095.1 protoporphyrinogen oxidase [Listeria monocytogenes]UIJ48573.1 protoporphyrinogen oxidase [Listeria monocytogenes]
MKHIVIIGGGLSGLAAAYELQKTHPNYTWELVEKDEKLGGKFETVKRDGFLIEKGPDSFLARKPAGVSLVKDLGLEDKLIANATGRSYIYHQKALHPIPEGSVMGIPTDKEALLASTLVSEIGKARALQEPTMERNNQERDQALGDFFEARFGKELVKTIIEPLLSGIYAGDIYKMSLRATFPQFEQTVKKYGNLMDGLKESSMQTTGTKATIGAFRTLEGGLDALPKAIAAALPKENLHTAKQATQIVKKNNAYEISFADGDKMEADGVIIAATHDALIHLLAETTTEPFAGQPLTTLATVSLAYNEQDVPILPDGTGYLVARTAPYKTTACTWVQKKWPHMVPKNKMLLRGFVGKAGETWLEQASDEAIVSAVLRDYAEIMDLHAAPLFYEVSRMKSAMPQYLVNHQDRLKQLKKNIKADYPGVFFAGMSYEGVGIPDCIAGAQTAAKELVDYLEEV